MRRISEEDPFALPEDEVEEELEASSESETESEPEENDVDMRDKPRERNAFLEDEAEESDEETAEGGDVAYNEASNDNALAADSSSEE